MTPLLVVRLKAVLALTDGLAASLGDAALSARNGGAPSNPVGDQFWCVVGGRESHARAIAASRWSGFTCSLGADDARRADRVRAALARSGEEVLDTLSRCEPTGDCDSLVLDLLEHEVQHHGQMIRYFYANGIRFPGPFAARYALAQHAGPSG